MADTLYVTFLIIPIIFFLYSIVLYTKGKVIYSIDSKKIEINTKRFYVLQFIFCTINSVLLLFEAFILYGKVNNSIFVFCYVITFWIVSYLLKFVSIKNNYINISN